LTQADTEMNWKGCGDLRKIAEESMERPLLNGVLGLCGESGECSDLLKKHLFQGHELNRERMVKELGDVAWCLAQAAHGLDCETGRYGRLAGED